MSLCISDSMRRCASMRMTILIGQKPNIRDRIVLPETFFRFGGKSTPSIRDLELPKGCMKVLAYLKEFQPASISDIKRSTGLSQRGVYSSLKRMRRLGILDFREEGARGKPNVCSLTNWGARLGCFVFAFIDTLREISGKYDVGPYLEMPVGSLSILVHIYQKGSITLSEAVTELGLCRGSASTALKRLTNLELIHSRKIKRFRRTTKEYKLREQGKNLARYLDVVDMGLQWKGQQGPLRVSSPERRKEERGL